MRNTWILIVGIIILVISLILDYLGLKNTQEGFGTVQIIGTIVGAILIIIAVVMMLAKKKSAPKPAGTDKPQE